MTDAKTQLDRIRANLSKLVAATNEETVRQLERAIEDAIARASGEFTCRYKATRRAPEK